MTSNEATAITKTVSDERRAGLLDRAVALQPLLRAHAQKMDAGRLITDEVNDALVEAGMFRLLTPARLGGCEAGLRAAVEVVATLGEADGSVAWLVGVGNSTAALFSRVSESAQRAVFGFDPGARLAGSLTPATATRVPGGVRISGRWANASGANHASWATIAAMVFADDGNIIDAVVTIVPLSDLRIEDTWHTVGMRATASNTLIGENVFVPEHMVVSVAQLSADSVPASMEDSTSRLPLSTLATLMLAAPLLGIGCAAVNLAVEKAPGKAVSQTSYVRQSDSVGVQIQLAEAAVKIKTAQLHVFDIAEEFDAAAARGGQVDYAVRAQARARAAYAASQVLEAIQIAMNVHGAGSFAESNRMQQYWRDANTAARHGSFNAVVGFEIYGKALMGLQERISAMV